jgi:hypothetical protein
VVLLYVFERGLFELYGVRIDLLFVYVCAHMYIVDVVCILNIVV